MPSQEKRSASLSDSISIREQIPWSDTLQQVGNLADQALDRFDPIFCLVYASDGRLWVPPVQLLQASLQQVIDGIRSERLLLNQLNDGFL